MRTVPRAAWAVWTCRRKRLPVDARLPVHTVGARGAGPASGPFFIGGARPPCCAAAPPGRGGTGRLQPWPRPLRAGNVQVTNGSLYKRNIRRIFVLRVRRTPVRVTRKVAEQDPPVSAHYLKPRSAGLFFHRAHRYVPSRARLHLRRAWPCAPATLRASLPVPALRERAPAARSSGFRVHPRRAESRHPLPLRSPGVAERAAGAAAPGAPLPHAHPLLLDARRARAALHQLAAGPAGQLPRAAGVPRAHPRIPRRGRSRRRDGGPQSVRLLPRAIRGTHSVPLRGHRVGASWRRSWCRRPRRRVSRTTSPSRRARRCARSTSWWR